MIVYSNGGGGGELLTVAMCKKIKSYEKILGELQNTCKNEKENKNQLAVQSRLKRLIASRKLNLIEVVHFTSVPACSYVSF